MKINCHEDEGHSLYNFFMYNYFNYFIDDKLPDNLKGLATQYFNEYNKTLF